MRWRACGRPDNVIGVECRIEERTWRGQVTNRRDTANCKPGLGADQRSVRLAQRFACQCARFFCVNRVASGSDEKDRRTALLTSKNDRLCDLINFGAQRFGGVLCRAGEGRLLGGIGMARSGKGRANAFQTFAHAPVLACRRGLCKPQVGGSVAS